MERLIKAWQNSIRAFGRLLQTETAFQQELGLLAVAVPLAWFLSTSWRGYALLVGAILVLIMIEVLNTGIEAACDAVFPGIPHRHPARQGLRLPGRADLGAVGCDRLGAGDRRDLYGPTALGSGFLHVGHQRKPS